MEEGPERKMYGVTTGCVYSQNREHIQCSTSQYEYKAPNDSAPNIERAVSALQRPERTESIKV
jgi:hypothetical protein